MNYLIPGPNLRRLTNVLGTLQQQIAALGYQLDFKLGNRTQVENESGVISEQLTLSVTADLPRFGRWIIVGALPCTAVSQHHLRIVLDCGVPAPYVDAAPLCDHCASTIRDQTIFIVRDQQAGHCLRVARGCLPDFAEGPIGTSADYAEMLMTTDEAIRTFETSDLETLRAEHHTYRLEKLLDVVAALIERDGWVSRKASQTTGRLPTVEVALDWMLANRPIEISPKAHQMAIAALAWAKNHASSMNDLNDYELKIRAIAQQAVIGYGDAGLAASMIAAYRAALARLADPIHPDRPSRPLGQVGGRSIFTLTVIETKDVETDDDVKILHKFVDAGGNRATWFASTGAHLVLGETYQLKATVLAHREYRGVMETILTRCKVLTSNPQQTPLAI
jgi:hypothetical protein